METYIPRKFISPRQSFFLFGARGTGKSTFLKKHYPDALLVDLLLPNIFRTYSAKPERIIELVDGNPEKKTIIIDEVQKVPELLSAVHSLIEKKKDLQFILTGSSARKLRKESINLLAGRLLFKTFHPFLLSELSPNYDLDFVLKHGLLPIVVSSNSPKETLEAYVSLYIQEEVYQESLVRNIGNFTRFLEAISFSHGSILNISNVARECEIERKVVENYITILEDILLAYRLPVFTKRAKRAVVKHPKFYFFDVGVFFTLRPKGPLDSPEEISGAALEGLIIQQLKTWNAYSGNPYELFFWRSQGGVEVDFVLYGESGIFAIEVKNTNRIRPADLRPLEAFAKDYPQSKQIYIYRGNEHIMRNNILCIPCEKFLEKLIPNKALNF
ncbi:MAG: AAA family ATPase [Melioribacteraceae bacterium]|nr:AAA family ATPase [Melioribacteraceae bacterium]